MHPRFGVIQTSGVRNLEQPPRGKQKLTPFLGHTRTGRGSLFISLRGALSLQKVDFHRERTLVIDGREIVSA